MQPTRDEPLSGLFESDGRGRCADRVEQSEWGRGQHEINFPYADPITIADMHVLFKQGVKEIAAKAVDQSPSWRSHR